VISADDLAHVLGVEARAESAVEPTRSQNMTVNWRRSASGETTSAAGMVETASPPPAARAVQVAADDDRSR
jgi:hypothetical protein